MRKLAAIFFISMYSFNLFGYIIIAEYMQHSATAQLEANLDQHLYNEADLVGLKVPMHLPYQKNWPAYQRCDGEIRIDGILYKYVKRKVSNDTLYVMCIPNTQKMKLEKAKLDFFKLTIDLVQNDGSQKSDNSKSTSYKIQHADYDEYYFKLNLLFPGENDGTNWLPLNSRELISIPPHSPEQPPDLQNV